MAVDTTVQPAPPGALTDADIAGVVMTANTGEIQQAQVALTRASSSAVRQFAQRMISDHTMANQMLEETLRRQNMTAAQNPLSQQLAQRSASTVESLQARTGADFDRTYMDTQVERHRWLLDSIDSALLPGARDRQLRATLERIRPIVADHLREAQQIRMSLGRP